MNDRICLLTFYPTKCSDNCYNCKWGGAEATENLVVTIHDVQRVCEIICEMISNATVTVDSKCVAMIIRNNLEHLVEYRNKGNDSECRK